ncbi:hypothetical protein Bhyg_15729 [Pseudolycoriella hygida]|uniref:Uncharacterized protein n=1 Tax=Pseudolycoriella hygida TaxID=35572 RepID=A0A9Q0RUZ1_9DIPT|nr:hypothetical protein Bhyg_15729 [Pseudolycoriella hygida]
MFSHLCRACMVELVPAEIVPLFEKYENVFLNDMCNAINLSNMQSNPYEP